MTLALENVNRTVGRQMHVDQIDLTFEMGSMNVLLGRTLAGKTTLLRLMAGLDRPTSGRIRVNGEDMTGVSVRKRSVAMVYQQFVNYPSMTVYQNIAAPLKFGGMKKSELDGKVRETAAMLRIDNLLDRLPAELSGGQQQRMAIARAMVKEAHLLLLDEPLVNLDYKLREELRVELQDIFNAREAVVVYTTTEPTEALMLGGNIVILNEGRTLQHGPTAHVYHHPVSSRVARVFSDPPINITDIVVEDRTALLGRDIRIPVDRLSVNLEPGPYQFGIHANHLFLSAESDTDITIPARVEMTEINGSETFVHFSHNDLFWAVQERGIHRYDYGGQIDVHVNPGRFFIFDPSGNLMAAPSNTRVDRSE